MKYSVLFVVCSIVVLLTPACSALISRWLHFCLFDAYLLSLILFVFSEPVQGWIFWRISANGCLIGMATAWSAMKAELPPSPATNAIRPAMQLALASSFGTAGPQRQRSHSTYKAAVNARISAARDCWYCRSSDNAGRTRFRIRAAQDPLAAFSMITDGATQE